VLVEKVSIVYTRTTNCLHKELAGNKVMYVINVCSVHYVHVYIPEKLR